MPNHRTYTEDQLRTAVANSTCWAEVMERIGKNRSHDARDVRRVAVALGLDASHFGHPRGMDPMEAPELPFRRQPKHGGHSGLSLAARWFLDRKYIVSVPLEPAPYDLVVESDDDLKRVQVKTTSSRASSGRFRVKLTRAVYDPTCAPSTRGNYRETQYAPGTIDFFFIATAAGDQYLIPYDVIADRAQIVLDAKYAAFAVS